MIAFRNHIPPQIRDHILIPKARKIAAACLRDARTEGFTLAYGVEPRATIHAAMVFAKADYADCKMGSDFLAWGILAQLFEAECRNDTTDN